ncbi:MAG: 16S rRNA (adenine(1518)-N(6)/adenine(1519)-N(6))-dimethyltransferase RsmA [Ruminococcus sp.]|nr:16S rRNA (adenine(1518)-N(6)/adenine(1519)-N(6))-dimethyltransferase RsmA [Ruminococcus sp.]
MEIKAKKSLGQNFLNDESVLKKIADSVYITSDDLIIEIGPGKGALTKYLVKKDSFFVAYEIDERMKDILSGYKNDKVKIIYGDFLQADILADINDIDYKNIYVIANIPYYITTPIIKKIIDLEKLQSMTLLVQKEVALRFSAEPNSKSYGSLTVFLNYYFDIKYLFTVKNTSFTPVPKVDSAVINFVRKEKNKNLKNEELFFKLVEDAFKMKRKTLKNNLKSYNWKKVLEVLYKYNLPENVRAEQVSLEVFIEIANNLT